MKCWEMKYYLNRYLPQDIGVLYVSDVPDRFHSRLNAVSKRYIYRVAVGVYPVSLTGNIPGTVLINWISAG